MRYYAFSVTLAGLLFSLSVSSGQSRQAPHPWPRGIKEIVYTSEADFSSQKALLFIPQVQAPTPLLVALHSWGGGHTQKISVPYGRWAVEHNWAFLHPNFRGPNRNPETTGSDLTIEDVVSAVEYALIHANIDRRRVYLIGYSGGGHLALLLAGRAPKYWAAVSAWVPIVDMRAWHVETRKNAPRYTPYIERSCGGPPGTSLEVDVQYKKRSPIHYLQNAFKVGVAFDLNTGLLDGHNGAPVPVSHALLAFNRVANSGDIFSDAEISHMVTTARVPSHLLGELTDDVDYRPHTPIYRRTSGRSRLTLFKGGHKLLYTPGLQWLGQQQRSYEDEAEALNLIIQMISKLKAIFQ